MAKSDLQVGLKHVALLRKVAKDLYGVDIDTLAQNRSHKFWAVGIDEKKNIFRDLTGDIDTDSLSILNKNFAITDAGFRASANERLSLSERVDIYLINTLYLKKSDILVTPLIAHEIAHYINQVDGGSFDFNEIDVANAQIVLASMEDKVRKMEHTIEWAKLLCMSARRAVERGDYSSIRWFLELAIPEYDRPHWNGDGIREVVK